MNFLHDFPFQNYSDTLNEIRRETGGRLFGRVYTSLKGFIPTISNGRLEDCTIFSLAPWCSWLAEHKTSVCWSWSRNTGLTWGLYGTIYDEVQLQPNELYNMPSFGTRPRITINVAHITQNITDAFKNIDEKLKDMKALSMYLQESPQHKVRVCLINRHGQKTWVIFTNKSTETFIDKLISLSPRFFSEYYEVGEEYRELYKAMAEGQGNTFKELFEDNISTQKQIIEALRLERKIKSIRESKANRKRNALESYRSDISNYESYMYEAYKSIKRTTIELEHILASDNSEELISFIKKNPYITLQNVSDVGDLSISVSAPIRTYNEEPAELYLRNRDVENSMLYGKKVAATLFEEVFIKQTHLLWFETYITIKENRAYCDQGASRNHRLGNPHLAFYDCWGDHSPLIAQALNQEDLISALDIIVAACCNINLDDGVVMDKFINLALHYDAEIADGGAANLPILQNIETEKFITPVDLWKELKRSSSNETN